MRSYERSGMTYKVVATSTSFPRRRQAAAGISVGYRRASISHPHSQTSGFSIDLSVVENDAGFLTPSVPRKASQSLVILSDASISLDTRKASIGSLCDESSGFSIRLRRLRMTLPAPKRVTTRSDTPSQPAPVDVLQAAQAQGALAR